MFANRRRRESAGGCGGPGEGIARVRGDWRHRLRIAGFATAVTALATANLAAGAGVAAAAAPVGYVPMSALINADSVTVGDGIVNGAGAPISLEQYAAQRAGYAVTVVSGLQWAAMTAAEFARYQVLVIGDPFCSLVPASVTGNGSVWASVVMGTSGQNSAVGNRVLVGTDPEYHYLYGGGGGSPTDPSNPATSGAEHLIQSGITYAGGVAGATGVYFDTTCGDGGRSVPVLNSLSASGTGFTENTSPPCGGSVQLIAANPVFSSLTDADIQGWSCSDHTTYPTYPPDWQPLAVATDTPTHPTCGTDPTTGTTACGESYVLVAGEGIVVAAPDLALTPLTGQSPAGGSHTVTATVTQAGSALAGQAVTFAVTGQNAGVSGTCAPASCLADAAGHVSFTYTDTHGAGTDTINASVTISGTTQHATAAQTWTAAANTPPVAKDVSATTPQNTPVGVTLSATDADSDPLTYLVVTNPSHGSLSGTTPNLTYTPASGYTGPDTFTYRANDGKTDSNTATATLTVTPVTGTCPHTAPAVSTMVSADQKTAAGKVVSPVLTTTTGNQLLLAFIETDGPAAPTQKITSVTGGGLAWTLKARSNTTWGTTEVWQAYATAPVAGAAVTATLAKAGYDGSITVAAFTAAAASVAAVSTGAGVTGMPSTTLTPTSCNSLIWAAGHDWSHATAPVAATGQTLVHTFVDKRVHDAFWTQSVNTATSSGTAVTVGDTVPTNDRWTLAAVEITAAT